MRGETSGGGATNARRGIVVATMGAIALCANAAQAQAHGDGRDAGASRATPSAESQSSGPVGASTSASSAEPAATASEARAATPAGALTAASLLVAPSEELDAAEADVRTAWIQSRLDAETPAAQRWYWIFLTLNAGATAGQFALGAILPDTDANGNVLPPEQRNRPGMYVGGVNAALGLLPMIVLPFQPAFAAGRLRGLPARTPAQRVERARRAEALLRECAEGEAFGQSWISHGLGVVVAAGSTLVLMLAFKQLWYWGLTNFITTIAFNELQVMTQPMQLVADWDTYRRHGWRNLATTASSPRHHGSDVRVMPTPFPGGAGIAVTF